MTGRWVANPAMPRTPFPPRFEKIRKAALDRWGETSISRDQIVQWASSGCPDATGSLLNAATHKPPLAGQPSNDPGALVTQLLEQGAFLPS